MGQTLTEPIKTKETATCNNIMFKVASSCMQGWRIKMEDAHTHLLSLPDDEKAAFFAVYDGHGGAKISEYAGLHLHKYITKNHYYMERKIPEAIKYGFLELDDVMLNNEELKEEMSGTTATVVLIKDNTIYCGNAGDSRAVVCVQGCSFQLSYDHKPNNETEQKRITDAGGWVEFNRVNGNLALSRALGDFAFKQNVQKLPKNQVVTAYPDIMCLEMNEDVEFIVIACDGIWDVMSSKEVVDFCRRRLQNSIEPEIICEELLEFCLSPDCELSGLGCDNMTVILICLLQGSTPERYVTRVSKPTTYPPIDDPVRMCNEDGQLVNHEEIYRTFKEAKIINISDID